MKKHERLLRRSIALVSAGLLFTGVSSADTIFVDDDGGGDYDNIADAVANAVDGDVIIVAPGTYIEEVIVDVSVTIAGSGMGQTIVLPATSNPGSGSGSQVGTTTWVFRIQDNNVTISGLTINGNNPGLSAGIDARGAVITDYSTGSYSGLEVLSCEFKNFSYRGVNVAAGGTGHSVLLNAVSGINSVALESAGIFFAGASGDAWNNTIQNCSIGVGYSVAGGGTIQDNTISACDLGALAHGATVPVTIQNNTITNCEQGVQTSNANAVVSVLANTVTGCTTGITVLGMGTGSHVLDGNQVDGQGLIGSSGIYASTDVSPYGFGDVTLTATNNVLSNNRVGVKLAEKPGNNGWVLDCTLSSDAGSYNSFWGNINYNVFLDHCQDPVDATHNMWGAVNTSLIENTLWHQLDDPSLGLINYSNTVNLYITVDDNGPADFSAISPAIQSLLPGGTILVKPGLYVEDLVVDRSCAIVGSGTSADPALGTTLKGFSIGIDMDVVRITASEVYLQDLRIDGSQPIFNEARRCVFASGVSGLNISDCVVHTAITGIVYDSGTNGNFLRNEIYDFGVNLNIGGGIFLSNANGNVGTPGEGNKIHNGLSAGIVLTAGSDGLVADNLINTCPLGMVTNSAGASTTFTLNEVRGCPQGYQSIGDNAPVQFIDNTAYDCTTSFIQYGLGNSLHTYTDNYVRQRLGTPSSMGFFLTTECPLGDDDLQAKLSGNIITGADFGIVLDESVSSLVYMLDVDMSGAGNPNWITGAGVQDILLQLCNDDVNAVGNFFGSTEPAVVENKITHRLDNPALGLVDFSGLLAPGPNVRRRGVVGNGREIAIINCGLPGNLSAPFYAAGPGSYGTPWGTLLIDPVTAVLLGTGFVNGTGLHAFEVLYNQDLPPGLLFYIQSLVGSPGSWHLTVNSTVLTTY